MNRLRGASEFLTSEIADYFLLFAMEDFLDWVAKDD